METVYGNVIVYGTFSNKNQIILPNLIIDKEIYNNLSKNSTQEAYISKF